MTEKRYEISTYIGPCSQEDAEKLMEAILDLPEHGVVSGGSVRSREAWDEEDE